MSKQEYISIAIWPEACPSDVSFDNHKTYEAASAVCDTLSKDGYGGDGEYYPSACWVERCMDKGLMQDNRAFSLIQSLVSRVDILANKVMEKENTK